MIKIFKKILLSCILMFGINTSINIQANSTEQTEFNYEGWSFKEITYEEMIEQISQDKKITVQEAKNLYPNLQTRASTNKYWEAGRVLLVVPNVYEPRLEFYLYGSFEDNTPKTIEKIEHVTLNHVNSISDSVIKSKAFAGEVYVNLENEKTIFFEVSGDFYDHGTTTWTGSGEIEIGEEIKLSGSVSYETDHYKAFYTRDRLVLKI